MTLKKLIIPAIIAGGTLLLLAMYFPGLRPTRPDVNVVAGMANIGGAFTLTDQRGNAVSSESLKGKYSLIYFGYAHCPDICPLTLATMTQALEIAGPLGEDVVPVFITFDPERDTQAALLDYAANFHPRFLALTGTLEQVKAAASAYRVYFKKKPETEPGEYTVDHSGYIYFMDRSGTYVTHFKSDAKPEQIAARIRQDLSPTK